MSEGFIEIWSAEPVNVADLLIPLGWTVVDDHLAISGRTWTCDAHEARRVFPEDIPEEVDALLPGIAWHVELSYEGAPGPSEKALKRAGNAIARASHGVLSDGSEAWTPRGVRRVSMTSRVPNEFVPANRLHMDWWALGGPLMSLEGISQLFDRIGRYFPEALPRKWDVIEPPSHRINDEGIEGLVGYLDAHRDEEPWMWPVKPIYMLRLRANSDFGGHFPRYQPTHFRIGLDASLLTQAGWPRQLARAFRAITEVIRPFYAEARIVPEGSVDPVGWLWFGLPQVPPFALAVGPPYIAHWPQARVDDRIDDAAIHTSDQWPQPPENLPISPSELRQEFDPKMVLTPWSEIPERRRQLVHMGVGEPQWTYVTPTEPPAVWPF